MHRAQGERMGEHVSGREGEMNSGGMQSTRNTGNSAHSISPIPHSHLSHSLITYTHVSTQGMQGSARGKEASKRGKRKALGISHPALSHAPFTAMGGMHREVMQGEWGRKESKGNRREKVGSIQQQCKGYQLALYLTSMHTHIHTQCNGM